MPGFELMPGRLQRPRIYGANHLAETLGLHIAHILPEIAVTEFEVL